MTTPKHEKSTSHPVRSGRFVAALAIGFILTAGAFGDTEDIARQKFIRDQFVKLTARMLEVADLLEKTEPATAGALREAVNQAQAAFITQDMDKVTELLSKGLNSMAATVSKECSRTSQ